MLRNRWLLSVVGALVVLAATAWSGGIPQTAPLTYAGLLTDGNGNPLTDSSAVLALRLFPADGGTTAVCSVDPPSPVPLTAGRFSIVLDQACVSAVRATPDLTVQVLKSGLPIGGRSKLGAVPFAVEAESAVKAQRMVMSVGSTSLSGNGLFCANATGFTNSGAAISFGGLNGYLAARAACAQTPGCSATAHLCSAQEMLNSHLLGLSTASNGWVASAGESDCDGFKDATAGKFGTLWNNVAMAGRFEKATCNNLASFLCCD